ncbi:reactive oxygen species modulator 1-like [Panonychus citri]|uniref:reactive oxygen species modulator 1-like n=1 Tax=Panonychus citri TaxID=50023 RepID=UPI0023072558|nr:reactive oxygen species modulator 1-like [Panonychus citri]
MPVPQGVPKGESPCFQRVKMGFTIGFMVGLGSGFLFGGFSSFRAGLRGISLLTNTGKVMAQGGGTFGTFMAIGSAIRC